MRKKETKDEKPEKKTEVPDIYDTLRKKYGKDVIQRASEVESGYHVRKPTGLPGLDLALGGGFPSAKIIQITGPESTGKNAVAYQTAANVQQRKGKDTRIMMAMIEGELDKGFARKIGLRVPYSKGEISLFEAQRGKAFTKEELSDLTKETGRIEIVHGTDTSEELFNLIVEATASDEYDLIVIDSIGTPIPEDDLYERRGSQMVPLGVGDEASFGRPTNFIIGSFNRRLCRVLGKVGPKGRPNLTCVLATHQVRADTGGRGGGGWKVAGSQALKHYKAGDVWLNHGTHLKENDLTVGHYVRWSIAKGKYGMQEWARGEIAFYYDRGFDVAEDLFTTLKNRKLANFAGGEWTLITNDGEVLASYGRGSGGQEEIIRNIRSNPEFAIPWWKALESLYPAKPAYEWVGKC